MMFCFFFFLKAFFFFTVQYFFSFIMFKMFEVFYNSIVYTCFYYAFNSSNRPKRNQRHPCYGEMFLKGPSSCSASWTGQWTQPHPAELGRFGKYHRTFLTFKRPCGCLADDFFMNQLFPKRHNFMRLKSQLRSLKLQPSCSGAPIQLMGQLMAVDSCWSENHWGAPTGGDQRVPGTKRGVSMSPLPLCHGFFRGQNCHFGSPVPRGDAVSQLFAFNVFIFPFFTCGCQFFHMFFTFVICSKASAAQRAVQEELAEAQTRHDISEWFILKWIEHEDKIR